jgi:hypothetical protein
MHGPDMYSNNADAISHGSCSELQPLGNFLYPLTVDNCCNVPLSISHVDQAVNVIAQTTAFSFNFSGQNRQPVVLNGEALLAVRRVPLLLLNGVAGIP